MIGHWAGGKGGAVREDPQAHVVDKDVARLYVVRLFVLRLGPSTRYRARVVNAFSDYWPIAE
jgi:hypothetical protein